MTTSENSENAPPEYSASTTLHSETAPPDDLWDDTPTALFLRACFTILAGGFLIYALQRAPFSTLDSWRATQCYLLAFLFIPVLVVWLFFAQTLRPIPLKNQALNAWNYGWKVRAEKPETVASPFHRVLSAPLLSAIPLCLVLLALRFWVPRPNDNLAFFPTFLSTQDAASFVYAPLIALCREWFFRGFLLFGVAQGFRGVAAPVLAIAIQAILFAWCFAPQFLNAPFSVFSLALFAVGVMLGAVSWHQRSFLAPFLAHAFLLLVALFLPR